MCKIFIFLIIIFIFIGCSNNGQPYPAPVLPQIIWIDLATHSDTIITGKGSDLPSYLYYAANNWQNSADTNITHGYRQIATRAGDSILVQPLNDISTNYSGPFFFHINADKRELDTQNFLDTSFLNSTRIFVPLN
ncbi:MAG: hypothetical protein ACR2FN_04715 [Chitinophagaceae bacterium]